MTSPAQNALRVRCDPVLGKIHDRLLAIGGTAVVLGADAPPAVRRLNRDGRIFAGDGAVIIPLDPRASATNVARLCQLFPGGIEAATGYALDWDGCWRSHAWGFSTGSRWSRPPPAGTGILGTCSPRLRRPGSAGRSPRPRLPPRSQPALRRRPRPGESEGCSKIKNTF